MNHLQSITNTADRAAVVEANNEALDKSMAFQRRPTEVNGAMNTIVGAPTAGAFPEHDLWVDALGAVFRCTAAGTPGAWVQVEPAFVSAFPETPPAGYWVTRTDQDRAQYIYVGGAWVQITGAANPPPIGAILPWAKSLAGVPALPTGWVECNGQTLSDAASPLNGQVIPNLNGENRFLRGNATSGGTGGAASHYHTCNSGVAITAGSDGYAWDNNATTTDASNEPPYHDVVWIMRVK